MYSRVVPLASLLLCCCLALAAQEPGRPQPGKVEIMKISEVKPGMHGTAWTVFQGSEPEPVPVEIVGLWKNAWGPRQDIIIAKLGGKAKVTNVAGGMSGSPVYVDGKLVGAIALRMSVFSPDAVCGITPIELMLEINDFDKSKPAEGRAPLTVSGAAGQVMTPIETPLTFSGFHENVLREYAPVFQQLGVTAVQGGASGALQGAKPAPGWENALKPGDAVAGVLVSGDMSVTGLGTVTYNDGKRVLAFGHPFFNLGPVEMPMSRGEVLMVLSSQYQPNKFANATEIAGMLKQDRHSGIMGVLGEEAKMIPVVVNVRTFGDGNKILKQSELKFSVFVNEKWTPYLMMFTLFNSLSGLNDFAEEVTYRLSGQVELASRQKIALTTIQAPGEVPIPAPMLLAGWWAEKFNRLFKNSIEMPDLRSVNVQVDLLPQRRTAAIETAWLERSEVEPGAEVPLKVFLRPYRGERMERAMRIKIPDGLPRGEYRILLSDADTLNRMQTVAGAMNRYNDVPQTVSLLNQERSNDRLYVSLVQGRPTLYTEDKTMPSLPASVLNVMQGGRTTGRPLLTSFETAQEQMSVPFDYMVSGSYSLRVTVK